MFFEPVKRMIMGNTRCWVREDLICSNDKTDCGLMETALTGGGGFGDWVRVMLWLKECYGCMRSVELRG